MTPRVFRAFDPFHPSFSIWLYQAPFWHPLALAFGYFCAPGGRSFAAWASPGDHLHKWFWARLIPSSHRSVFVYVLLLYPAAKTCPLVLISNLCSPTASSGAPVWTPTLPAEKRSEPPAAAPSTPSSHCWFLAIWRILNWLTPSPSTARSIILKVESFSSYFWPPRFSTNPIVSEDRLSLALIGSITPSPLFALNSGSPWRSRRTLAPWSCNSVSSCQKFIPLVSIGFPLLAARATW